jgi:multiple sugar transport system ATP-binding protein
MNIKTVPLTEAGANFAGMILPLSREQVGAAHNGGGNGTVTVGFRPEDTDLVSETEGGMPIVVDLVEELGSDAYVYGHVNLSGADERFVVRTDGRRTPRMGDTVFVKPRVGHHHAFHAVAGTRI